MKKLLDLTFEVIKEKTTMTQNSAGCNTNGRSGCCSTYCTAKACNGIDDQNNINAWEQYLQLNAGVLQY